MTINETTGAGGGSRMEKEEEENASKLSPEPSARDNAGGGTAAQQQFNGLPSGMTCVRRLAGAAVGGEGAARSSRAPLCPSLYSSVCAFAYCRQTACLHSPRLRDNTERAYKTATVFQSCLSSGLAAAAGLFNRPPFPFNILKIVSSQMKLTT